MEAFKELKWFVDAEGDNLAGRTGLGMLAGLGIVKASPSRPTPTPQEILTNAAKTAYKTSRVIGMRENVGERGLACVQGPAVD